jgi:hypothetical protein
MDPRKYSWIPYTCRYVPGTYSAGLVTTQNQNQTQTQTQTQTKTRIQANGNNSHAKSSSAIVSVNPALSSLGSPIATASIDTNMKKYSSVDSAQDENMAGKPGSDMEGAPGSDMAGILGPCLRNKRILFSGDSHMRTLFNSVMHQACGVGFSAQKGHATSQCHMPNASSREYMYVCMYVCVYVYLNSSMHS